MYKPNSLRKHLTAANPDLKRDPDKLLVFADEGRLIATGTVAEIRDRADVREAYLGTGDA